MLPTTKCSLMKENKYQSWILWFFIGACVTSAILDSEPTIEVTVEQSAKEACIETHQTLNRNESQEICGQIVSMK